MTSGRQLKPQPPTFLLGGNGGMAGNEAHLHSPRRAVRCASFSSPSSTTKPLVRNVCWTASRRLLYGRRAPRCQWRGGGLKTALHVGPLPDARLFWGREQARRHPNRSLDTISNRSATNTRSRRVAWMWTRVEDPRPRPM